MEINTSQRRKHNRLQCDVRISYTSGPSFGNEYMRDLSMGGAFMETMEIFTVGDPIRLTIPFSNQNNFVKVKGHIGRIADEGVGVIFHSTKA